MKRSRKGKAKKPKTDKTPFKALLTKAKKQTIHLGSREAGVIFDKWQKKTEFSNSELASIV